MRLYLKLRYLSGVIVMRPRGSVVALVLLVAERRGAEIHKLVLKANVERERQGEELRRENRTSPLPRKFLYLAKGNLLLRGGQLLNVDRRRSAQPGEKLLLQLVVQLVRDIKELLLHRGLVKVSALQL
ncbi:MAG: hypothetical protein GQ524_07585 [Anaerolineales bacterium]|nr:hypothetical protein [Anaerolineales bacterium]